MFLQDKGHLHWGFSGWELPQFPSSLQWNPSSAIARCEVVPFWHDCDAHTRCWLNLLLALSPPLPQLMRGSHLSCTTASIERIVSWACPDPPIPSLCSLLVGTKHPSLPPLCVPFQPCLGTLAGKDGSIAKANVHPLLKRDYYWASERRNLTMMWQVVSHCQSALRDPTPAGFALCPSPPGAVTSPGTNIRATPNSQLCGQSPPRSSASPTAGRKALGDIPLTSHSHSFAVSCTHCFQCPQRQQDTHTTTSSPAKQEPSSTSYSAATGQTGQYPRAWLINAMAYNYSLQSDSEIKRFPPLS